MSYTLKSEVRTIPASSGKMKVIFLFPEKRREPVPAVLWIHGGGYVTGMASMVHFSVGRLLGERHGLVVVSPEYRLAGKAQYPAALEDCHTTLAYMYENAEDLGIDRKKIIVGGESAGGGLTAALCLYERDRGGIPIAYQLPLYPMLDCEDTSTSRDNHGKIWDTKRNHYGWSHYLGSLYGMKHVPKYASPARETDYHDLPEAYTFVADGEPFYEETVTYIRHLQDAGIPASMDVYHGNVHAFDMVTPWSKESKLARETLFQATDHWFTDAGHTRDNS